MFKFFRKKNDKAGLRHSELFSNAALNPNAEIDIYSGTWAFINNHLVKELDSSRKANDSVNKTPEQTAALRGRIALLKELIALPDDKTKPRNNSEDGNYDY